MNAHFCFGTGTNICILLEFQQFSSDLATITAYLSPNVLSLVFTQLYTMCSFLVTNTEKSVYNGGNKLYVGYLVFVEFNNCKGLLKM